MNNEYKTIPFAEVKIGQEFEDRTINPKFTSFHWVKLTETSYREVGHHYIMSRPVFPKGCLVRTADCEELDFATWFKESPEGQQLSHIDCAEEAARAGWDAAKAK